MEKKTIETRFPLSLTFSVFATELEHKPEVTVTRVVVGDTRKVVLTWKVGQ